MTWAAKRLLQKRVEFTLGKVFWCVVGAVVCVESLISFVWFSNSPHLKALSLWGTVMGSVGVVVAAVERHKSKGRLLNRISPVALSSETKKQLQAGLESARRDIASGRPLIPWRDFSGYAVDEPEVYDLDRLLAAFISPHLKKLAEIGATIPVSYCELDDDGKVTNYEVAAAAWKNDISKMIVALELVAKNERHMLTEYQQSRVQEGLVLFAKHYFDLWR